MATFKFTPQESLMITHRLLEPECIAEALEIGYEEVRAIVGEMTNDYREGNSLTVTIETELATAILKDAIEGSTFFNGLEDEVALGEISKGKALSFGKSAKTIEAKTGFCFN